MDRWPELPPELVLVGQRLVLDRLGPDLRYSAASTTLGTETCSSLKGTRLFIEFPPTHFLLDPASLDELTEAANCLLNAFAITNNKLYHATLAVCQV